MRFMALHELEPTPESTVNVFSAQHEPVLTMDPGDTVIVRTLDAAGYLARQEFPGDARQPKMFTGDFRGHCLNQPIAVRGARNYPCMGHPGKRAPTVEICNSDKPFEPLALRQHALGPNQLDPNLLSQGVPPDDRVTSDKRMFGPREGTPLPPGSPGPRGTPPGPPLPSSLNEPPSVPAPLLPPAPPPAGPPAAAPSSFSPSESGPGPSVAVLHYDPHTGRYVRPDGQMFRQSDLVRSATPKSWKDLIFAD